MTNVNESTPIDRADERETWVQPTAAKFRAGDAETSGGVTNEGGLS